MSRIPAFPAGTLLEIRAAGLHPARPLDISLRTLDAPGRAGAPFRALVLEPGAPEHGLPAGRVCVLRLERGDARAAARVRESARSRKLIRCAAGIELGSESCVADVYASVFDRERGWTGTLEEWIEGRFWRLETDRHVFDRPRPSARPELDNPALFRTEYDAKRLFMARLVALLRRVGAEDLARRYDWSTWLSQRKVLKRTNAGDDPHAGWTATDFKKARLHPVAFRKYSREHPGIFREWRALVQETAGGKDPADGHIVVYPPDPVAGARGPRPGLAHGLKHSWRMLFRPEMRNARLLTEVQDGLDNHILTAADAERIHGQIHDPMLQTYLVCLAVHVAMLPVTNLTVLAGALWYSWTRDLSFAEGTRLAALGWAFFAVAPISPGSLARGLFVVGVALKRRSARGLKIALALSFWKFFGYMALPLQMIGAFPALARYLAARWATHAVRVVPTYGRPGGLLEHRAFDLAFNLPLTLARRRSDRRAAS